MILDKIYYVNDGTNYHIIVRCSLKDIEITLPLSMIKYHNESIDDSTIRTLIKKDKLHVSSINPQYSIGPKGYYFTVKIKFIESRHEFIICDIDLKENSNVLSIGFSSKLPEEIPNDKSSSKSRSVKSLIRS